MLALSLTIVLGSFFMLNQGLELKEARLSIRDSVFARTFFTLTGLHGLHVTLGLLLLGVRLVRMRHKHFRVAIHVYFETSI